LRASGKNGSNHEEPPLDAPTELTDRYTRAVELARTLHDGEPRKGTPIPYFAHPLSVSALVLEHGGSEDQAIAALLHDTAEDHGGSARIDQIRADFGDTVADIVAACSDSLVEDRTQKAPWWDRKTAYLEHLAHEPAEVALVSAADKLHNARAILTDYRVLGDELWSKFNAGAGRAGTLWYYTRLTEILTDRLAGTPGEPLATELTRTVDELLALVTANGHDPQAEIEDRRAHELAARP
jgi:(p)ppGpp synthase/HD superfamily hydrolase